MRSRDPNVARQLNIQPQTAAAPRAWPIIAYLCTALIYLWPLPLHFFSAIPGDNGDSYGIFWHFWYYPHALLRGHGLFYHDLLFYPDGVQLVFTSGNTIGAVLMAPVALLISPAAALNAWLVLHLWLGGYLLYLFCRRLGCGAWAAWLGGFCYQWSPFLAAHLPGHYTLAQVAFPTLAMLALAKLVDGCMESGGFRRPGKWGFVLGLTCWAVAVSDFYLGMMTVFLLITTLAALAIDPQSRPAFRQVRFWSSLASGAVLCLLLLTPWILAVSRAKAGHDYSGLLPFLGSKNVAAWSRLITPPAYHFFWEPRLFSIYEGKLSVFNEWTYLGMAAFLIAGVGLLYVRPIKKILPWTLAFFAALGLAAGNRLSLERGWAARPWDFGQWWPKSFPFSEFRVPGRWQFALCTTLSVGLALGCHALLYRAASKDGSAPSSGTPSRIPGKKRMVVALSMMLLIAIDQTRWPMPICPARPLQAGIAPGPFVGGSADATGTVLDIPVGITSGQGHSLGQFDVNTLLRQMTHGRPLLSVNVSRLPNDIYLKREHDRELMALLRVQGSIARDKMDHLDWQSATRVEDEGTSWSAEDILTSSALNWPAFRERYNITTVRLPLEWPTSATLQKLSEKMGPNHWVWRTEDDALIGTWAKSDQR